MRPNPTRVPRWARSAAACAAGLLLPAMGVPAMAAELTWNSAGPNQRWLDGTNWIQLPAGGGSVLPGFVPGAADRAVVNFGEARLDGVASVGELDLRSFYGHLTIESSGRLSLAGDSSAAGMLEVQGALGVAAGRILTVGSSWNTFQAGAVLDNKGIVRIAPNASLDFLAGAVLQGSAAGLLDINGGRINLQSTLDIGRLRMVPDARSYEVAGILAGRGTASIGAFEWGHGSIGTYDAPDALTRVTGTALIGNTILFAYDGTPKPGVVPSLRYGRELRLEGATTWAHGVVPILVEGAGTTADGSPSAVSLLNVTGSFEDLGQPTDNLAIRRISGAGRMLLAGSYLKSGPGLSLIETQLRNTGSIEVNAGRLLLAGDTVHDGATIRIGPAGTLHQFNGLITGRSSIVNQGTLRLDYNTAVDRSVTYAGAANSFLDIAAAVRVDADMAGSALRVTQSLQGSGTVTASTLAWVSGSMGGTEAPGGSTIVRGAAALSTSVLGIHGGRRVQLDGVTTWARGASVFSGLGTLNIGRDSVLTVGAGGVFEDLGEGVEAFQRRIFSPDFGAAGRFVNQGTYRRSGAGGTIVQADFANEGRVEVDSGTLYMAFNFDNRSAVQVADGATLVLAGNTVFAQGASLTGPGAMQVRGVLRADGDMRVEGATTLALGVVHGAGRLQLGTLDWSGGMFGNPNLPGSNGGMAAVARAATLDGNDHLVTGGYRLQLDGETRFLTGRRLILGQDAVLTVGAGGVFRDEAGAYIDRMIVGAGGRMVNAGSYIHSGFRGTTTVTAPFANSGTVRVDEGALELRGGAEFSAGSLTVAPDASALLQFGAVRAGASVRNDGLVSLAEMRFDAGAAIAGGGRFDILTGRTTFDADATLGELRLVRDVRSGTSGLLVGNGTVTTGKLVWDAGAWMGEPANPGGRTVVTGDASLVGNGGGANGGPFRLEGSRILELNGRTTWEFGSASIDIGMFNPISPAPQLVIGKSAVFEDLGGNFPTAHDIAGAGVVINRGSFLRTGIGAGYTRIGTAFINHGLVEVRAGELWMTGQVDNTATGELRALPGTYLSVDSLANWDAATRTLSGGRYVVGDGGNIRLALASAVNSGGPASIRRNDATIVLEGKDARLLSLVRFFGERSALDALEHNAGGLELRNGAVMASAAPLLNTGALVVDPGSALTLASSYTQGPGAVLDLCGRLDATGYRFSGGVLRSGAGATIGHAVFGAAPASFAAGSELQVDIDANANAGDLFEFGGAAVIGGRLSITFHGAPGAALSMRFLNAGGGISGAFDSITANGLDLSRYRVDLATTGNDLTLTLAPVPEPYEWALLLAGLGLVAGAARRRRKRTSPTAACTD